MAQAVINKKNTVLDYLVMGVVVVIGLTETAHLAAIIFGWTFTRCATVLVWLLAAGVLLLVPAFIFYRKIKTGKGRADCGTGRRGAARGFFGTAQGVLFAFCAASMAAQIIFICMGDAAYRQGDMTVETVGSFLVSDGIYRVNPMTGAPYSEGLPSRLKVLCLPTLYGSLCRLTGLAPRTVVWKLVPVVTLALSYASFAVLGYWLFRGERALSAADGESLSGDGRRDAAEARSIGIKLGCYMAAVSLLMWAGTYGYGVDGFDLLYCGYRGTVIRNTVLVPWLFSLCLRRKWLCAVLCILAEACMVWTFYGMGVCLFITVCMAAIQLFQRMPSPKRKE